LILAWTEEEAARYLETFKAFEGKDASLIQKKKDMTFPEQVADALSCIRSVNKTDSVTLLSQFGNVKNIMTASLEDIRQCPGIGEKKAKRLFDAFHKPFSSTQNKRHNVETNEELDTESKGNVGDILDESDVVILD
jgi:DNA excision repair protein ERCC-1